MAVTKTITANGSKGHHTFTLTVSEDSYSGNSSYMSYTFKMSPIQTGWDWYGHNISFSVGIGGKTYTGTIPNYNGSSTVTLKSGNNIEIVHNSDGTKTITVSFSVTDSSGQNYTCGNASASGSMTLTPLHKPPVINTATMVETNQDMIDLGIPDTTIVPWLSQKTITLNVTAYDNATLSYRLRHAMSDYYMPSPTTYQASNIFNADYRTNLVTVTNGKVGIMQYVVDNKGGSANDLVLVEIGGTPQQPQGIPYFKPTFENTSTGIKRKSGSYSTTLQRTANLTDNIATLNIVGNIYKGNDAIGNNNSITQIGYKIWQRDASEPANYTAITPTVDASGNITLANEIEITNIYYTEVYYYKIILTDNYNYTYLLEGTVPTGLSVWTEYKDRVDFLRATREGLDIYANEYSTTETPVGTFNGDVIYRQYLGSIGSLSSGTSKNFDLSALNIDEIVKVDGMIEYDTNYISSLNRIIYYYNTTNDRLTIYNNLSNLSVDDGFVYIEYTKQ